MLGLIGIDLSLVTIAGLPILIGLGIDFAIQVHNRIEEEVLLDHDEHPIGETLANLAPPLIAATLTGVVAFLALRISKVPMIRDFGVLLAVGIVMLVIVGIIVPGSVLGVREYKRPTDGEPKGLVGRAGRRQARQPADEGRPDHRRDRRRPVRRRRAGRGEDTGSRATRSSGSTRTARSSRTSSGSRTRPASRRTLGVLVQANNVYDQQVIDLIWDFTLDAEAREEVVTSSSLVNTMGKILMVPGATPISAERGRHLRGVGGDAAKTSPAR